MAIGYRDTRQGLIRLAASLRGILPTGVSLQELLLGETAAALLPGEEQLVRNAVIKRRKEFQSSRHCARKALAQLGIEPQAIGVLPSRAPDWPSGISGSITHCNGYTAAAVAWTRDVSSLGIDAELNQPLPAGVLSLVASEKEQAHLSNLPPLGIAWGRVLFSAKESVYKAWSQRTGLWLDFLDAEIHIDATTGAFHVFLPANVLPGGSSMSGRFACNKSHVFTAVTIQDSSLA